MTRIPSQTPSPPEGLTLSPRAEAVAAGPTVAEMLASLPPELAEAVRDNLQASRAPNTLKAYAADWKVWSTWCRENAQPVLPSTPQAVAGFLSAMAAEGRKVSTLRRYWTTIMRAHNLAKITPNPARDEMVRLVRQGINRKKGNDVARKMPLAREELQQLIAQIPTGTLRGLRDRALLLLGFATALRADNLVRLEVRDVSWFKNDDGSVRGIVVHIRASKTDQLGVGSFKPVRAIAGPMCPVAALSAWLDASRITAGPLFRSIHRRGQLGVRHLSTHAVSAQIVKPYVERAGLNPEIYAGHSLRAGFVTQGLDDGVDPRVLQEVTGHTSLEMLLRYDRRKLVDPFKGAAPNLLEKPR